MRRWIFAWLGYWQALYIRGAALLLCLAAGLAGSIIIGSPLLLLSSALGAGGTFGLVLAGVTVFPIVAGLVLRLFPPAEAPQRPPSWAFYKAGVKLPAEQ